ncbi:MAG: ABC-2 transporter permease [Candidatus Delongbacteria bacterium]
MKNLIVADLKVLGHRMWSVPLIALILVAGVSLIPNIEMADPVRNFMIALLSPCLLIFELFREEQKRGTDSLMLTMPVNKNVYVMAKYTTVIILGLTAIPAGWLAALFTNVIQTGNISLTESLSFLPNMLKIMTFVIPCVFFVLPIYFFIRNIVVSAVIVIVLVFFLTERMLTLFYEYFYVSFFDGNLYLIFYFIGMILIPASLIHLIIKLWFRSISDEAIKTGWFVLVYIMFLFVFETLMTNIQYTDYYIFLTGIVDGSDGIKKERIIYLIANYRLYVPIILIVLITIGSALFIIRRKSSQLFWQNAILYILAPITIIILSGKIVLLVWSIYKNVRYYHTTELFVFTMITIVSFKASVYLLKNNRTLK